MDDVRNKLFFKYYDILLAEQLADGTKEFSSNDRVPEGAAWVDRVVYPRSTDGLVKLNKYKQRKTGRWRLSE